MAIRCPDCSSARFHRSKKKGLYERLILSMFFVRPFRCDECDFRFFRWSLTEKPGPSRPSTAG